MGSAGTIAAADRLKQEWHDHKIVGLEPIQCPTLALNGYGGHDIQGIGDKHVTWIHNVNNMDAIMCIDDIESKKALQIFADEGGLKALVSEFGIPQETVDYLKTRVGISSICNIFGAIKTVKHYGLGKDDLVGKPMGDDVDGGDIAGIPREIADVEADNVAVASLAQLRPDGDRDGAGSRTHVPNQEGLGILAARRAGKGGRDARERQFDQRLRLGARDEHSGVDGDDRAIELLHAANVGDRLTSLAPLQACFVALHLRRAQDLLRMRHQRGAIDPDDVAEQDLGIEARRL